MYLYRTLSTWGLTVLLKSSKTISPHAASRLLTYIWSVGGTACFMERATVSPLGRADVPLEAARGWETPERQTEKIQLCTRLISYFTVTKLIKRKTNASSNLSACWVLPVTKTIASARPSHVAQYLRAVSLIHTLFHDSQYILCMARWNAIVSRGENVPRMLLCYC